MMLEELVEKVPTGVLLKCTGKIILDISHTTGSWVMQELEETCTPEQGRETLSPSLLSLYPLMKKHNIVSAGKGERLIGSSSGVKKQGKGD